MNPPIARSGLPALLLLSLTIPSAFALDEPVNARAATGVTPHTRIGRHGSEGQLLLALGPVELDDLRSSPNDYHAKFAVIVGIDAYSQSVGFDPLQNAGNDASEVRKLLVAQFGYDDDRILYLTDRKDEPKQIVDGPPTLKVLRSAFENWLPDKKMQAEDSVLFFYAGHGLRDAGTGEVYISASDSNIQEPKNTCVNLGWIRQRLGDKAVVKCRHKLVLLDCCFSGGLFFFDQPLTARPVPAAPEGTGTLAGARAQPPGATRGNGSRPGRDGDDVSYYLEGEAFVGMTAGLGDQPVSDGTGQHSLFTGALLRAMIDRADSVRKDHVFTFTELSSYLRPRVAAEILKRDTLSNQIPMAGRLVPGSGDFVFRQSVDTEVPWERAWHDARRADSRRLTIRSDLARSERLDLAILLAAEAVSNDLLDADLEARGSVERSLDARTDVVRILHVPEGEVTCLALGPGGTVAAGYRTIYGRGGVVLFDALGRRIRNDPLDVPEGNVSSVAFGPNGIIGAGYGEHHIQKGNDGGVVAFDTRGNRLWHTPLGFHEGYAKCISFGPGGTVAAGTAAGYERYVMPSRDAQGQIKGDYTVLRPGVVALFDARGRRVQLASPEGDVLSVSFDHRGNLAAASNNRVDTFDSGGGHHRSIPLKLGLEGFIKCVALSPQNQIAVGYDNIKALLGEAGGGVVMYDNQGRPLRANPLEVNEGNVTCVAMSPEGAVAAGFAGGVVAFDAKGQRVRSEAMKVLEGEVTCLAYGPDGMIAAGYGGRRDSYSGVAMLKPLGGDRLRVASLQVPEGSVVSVTFGSAGTVAAGFAKGAAKDPNRVNGKGYDDGGGVVVFDPQDGWHRRDLHVIERGGVACVALGPEGTLAAGSDEDNRRFDGRDSIMMFDARGNSRRLMIPDGDILSVAFGPEKTLAAACSPGEVILFDAIAGNRLRSFPIKDPESFVKCAAFGQKGQSIVAGIEMYRPTRNGVVAFNSQGLPLFTDPLEVPEGEVTRVAIGPEGTIAAGFHEGVVLYNASGQRVQREALRVEGGYVSCVAFSPEGMLAIGYMLYGRWRGGVLLFDRKGVRVRTAGLDFDLSAVTCASFYNKRFLAIGFSRFGHREYSGLGYYDGGVYLLDVDPASWMDKLGQVANRNLTWREWGQYFPQIPYRRTFQYLPWPYDLPQAEQRMAASAEAVASGSPPRPAGKP